MTILRPVGIPKKTPFFVAFGFEHYYYPA